MVVVVCYCLREGYAEKAVGAVVVSRLKVPMECFFVKSKLFIDSNELGITLPVLRASDDKGSFRSTLAIVFSTIPITHPSIQMELLLQYDTESSYSL